MRYPQEITHVTSVLNIAKSLNQIREYRYQISRLEWHLYILASKFKSSQLFDPLIPYVWNVIAATFTSHDLRLQRFSFKTITFNLSLASWLSSKVVGF